MVGYTPRMAESVRARRPMSVEEYLEFERNSPIKHEFVGGHIYAMVGVSRRHSRISLNIASRLLAAARSGPCRVHQSDMKVLTPDDLFYYPDVVVACGPEPEEPDLEDKPCLIVEVLSPTTAQTDRREKLAAYKKFPSLQAYLIISQDERKVGRHFRDENDDWWQAEIVGEGNVPIPCPKTELSLAEIYEGF